jgi:hypothetical protein
MGDWLEGATRHYTDWMQEIDQGLLNAENFIREHDIVVDLPWGQFRLSNVVDGLREGFELLFFRFPDPDLLRKQANNLDDLHAEGQDLLNGPAGLRASLLYLSSRWQGPSAETYLGPHLGPMSDTQMEAYDQAHKNDAQPEGWLLYANLRSVVDALAHNAQSHHDLAHNFTQVNDAQGDMRWMVVGGAADVAVMVAQPETAEVTLPTAVVTSGQVVENSCRICRILRILALVVGALAVIGAAGVGIYLITSGITKPQGKKRGPVVIPKENTIFAPIPTGTPVPPLTKEQEDLAAEFATKYARDGCSKADYENLIQRILARLGNIPLDQIRRIMEGLRLLSQLQRLEGLLQALGYPGLASNNPGSVGRELSDIQYNYFYNKDGTPKDPSQWTQALIDDAQLKLKHICSVYQVSQRTPKATDIDHDVTKCPGAKDTFYGQGKTSPVDVYRPDTWTEVKSGDNNPSGAIGEQLWDSYIRNIGCSSPPPSTIELVITGNLPARYDGHLDTFLDEVVDGMFNQSATKPTEAAREAARLADIKSKFPGLSDDEIKKRIRKMLKMSNPSLPECPPSGNWC